MTARIIPNIFIFDNFSLKNNNPKTVENKTIETLLIVKTVELSKPFVCRAFNKKNY